jgi:hypothetical protein
MKITLIPCSPDKIVPDESGKRIPPDGVTVKALNRFWRRRIADGDVREADTQIVQDDSYILED